MDSMLSKNTRVLVDLFARSKPIVISRYLEENIKQVLPFKLSKLNWLLKALNKINE